MLTIGLATCGNKPLTDESFREMVAAGIGALEISQGDYDSFDFDNAKTLAQRYGVKLWSLHLPFGGPYNPADLDPANRKFTVEEDQKIITRAVEAGITRFVIHPSCEPNEPETREEKMRYSMETLSALAEFAAEKGAVLAVENLPRTCLGNRAAELKEIISANDKLRVCFDFNHSLGEDNSAYIKLLGDKIITTHVSDYDMIDERHWLPGEGNIDWVEMITLMEQIGYQGVWMYELGFSAPKSIDRRELTWQDFGDNARTIFAKQQPTAIGKSLL